MKKYVAIFAVILLGGCLQHYIDETPQEVKDDEFVINVPKDFNWSSIAGIRFEVTLTHGNKITYALDSTLLELYDEDDVLIDALTIYDGKAEFNIRIPTSSTKLILKAVASNASLEIAPGSNNVQFDVPNISSLSYLKVDSDSDGLYDAFDADPLNQNVTISINKNRGTALKSAQGKSSSTSSYVIFEDLWPSKGDYDFNDLVSKTTFSWERGKSNYIEEIEGVCEIEFIGAGIGLGLGFELFESAGSHLVYLDDIIKEVEKITEDNSVTNGFVIFSKVQSVSTNQVEFKIKLKDKALKSFLCVPYLFRTDDYGHQVRPFGAPPTEGQRMSMFRSGNDYSPNTWSWEKGSKFKYPLDADDAFFKSQEKHPWGIEFITKIKFKPSPEGRTIIRSYPKFRDWAESGGKKDKTWYEHPE